MLGQNLSHIDAYNGEEKVHMGKKHICGELDAPKIIISFCKRNPQVLWAYIFKGVYVVGAWFSRTKALKPKKAKRDAGYKHLGACITINKGHLLFTDRIFP